MTEIKTIKRIGNLTNYVSSDTVNLIRGSGHLNMIKAVVSHILNTHCDLQTKHGMQRFQTLRLLSLILLLVHYDVLAFLFIIVLQISIGTMHLSPSTFNFRMFLQM